VDVLHIEGCGGCVEEDEVEMAGRKVSTSADVK
jgi:hypothetical protein